MNKKILSIAVCVLFVFAACNSSKKNINTTANTKPSNGVYAPTSDELAAAQVRNNATTMEMLNEGYAIYTGACTKCHAVKNIYTRNEAQWMHIMDEMAPKAKLTAQQKSAVTQYVMAIKGAKKS